MIKTKERSKYQKKTYIKLMERLVEKNKNIDMYALWCHGFKTGYNRKVREMKDDKKDEIKNNN